MKLIYDDRCGLCRAWVRWLKERDDISVISFESCSEFAKQSPPQDWSCEEVWLFSETGQYYRGAEAIPQILLQLKGYSWLGRIFGLIIFRKPLRLAYRVLSRNRYFLTKVLGSW